MSDGSAPPRRAFRVDLGRCTGCGACVLACRLENGWPEHAAWRRVVTLNQPRVPAGPTCHLSLACHHCAEPACVKACPSGAYERRADGVVVHDDHRCLGCRYCEMACPFGSPRFNPVTGLMGKCSLCDHRLDRGRQPACVAGCPTGALCLADGTPAPEQAASAVPGFDDPAGCRPRTCFTPPRHGTRRARFEALRAAVEGEDRR